MTLLSDLDTVLVPLGSWGRDERFAIIDAIDAEEVFRHRWHLKRSDETLLYAHTNVRRSDGTFTTLTLHRLVARLAGFGDCAQVDHVNIAGLDCRRSNLRPATRLQNARNKRLPRSNTSGIKGVSWDRHHGKWLATINDGAKKRFIGRYDNPDDARAAVMAARARLHGEFACHG